MSMPLKRRAHTEELRSPFCQLLAADEYNTPSISVLLELMVRDPEQKTDDSVSIPRKTSCWNRSGKCHLTGIQPNSSRITNENSTLDDFSRTFPLKDNLHF